MSAFLDTNILVRYLIGDSPELTRAAMRIIDNGDNLRVTGVALVETAYVLTSVYRLPRAVIVDSLIALLRKRNIRMAGLATDAVIEGLLLCRPSGRVSFADALIWAAARASDTPIVYSFDQRFPANGVEVRQSPA